MRPKNSHIPPEQCPICSETVYEDKVWSGANVRLFGCGMFYDCHVGVVSYQPLTALGARDVATEHFQRLLTDAGHTFVGIHNV